MRSLWIVLLLLGCVGFGAALATAGCTVPVQRPAPPDAAVVSHDWIRCRGPEDAGSVVWWVGIDGIRPSAFAQIGTRYVCKDHGPGSDGYWFEAEPER